MTQAGRDMANPQLQLAHDFVRSTGQHVFLTGKAGTGKTTFLHSLKHNLPKRMIVTAPTGVAAINAGGVTLHSFFQLPFGPFVPGGDAERQASERHFSRRKRDIIRTLDLLVIDEISMVRCDLLDAVDFVLRRERARDEPFGGVQLLLIGDLHQLSPVVPDRDWAILGEHYASGYFFSARALQATEVVPIELQHIYRQSDIDFIELLNRVRDNRLDETSLDQLNSRYQPGFDPDETDGYITLTTHNRAADETNGLRLRSLEGQERSFVATIEDDYPEHAYPTAERLTLKLGAQVMFVRNDSSADKRYFNGKIGTVTELEHDRISVRCPGDHQDIEVEPTIWENIKYSIDDKTKEITEEVIGRFIQYPLRLAWAITIHKSQGLTFERAIIDAARAFSHGQVYVALSRCKTFEGMVLSSAIPRRAVRTDPVVAHYVDDAALHAPDQARLQQARTAYQQRLLQECWDFDEFGRRLQRVAGLLRGNRQVVDAQGMEALDEIEKHGLDAIVTVALKFRRQLQAHYRLDTPPESDDYIQERVRKAAVYFSDALEQGLRPWLGAFSFSTDNKALRTTIRRSVGELREALAIKSACIEGCRDGFSTPTYLDARAKASLDDDRGPAPPRPRAEPDEREATLPEPLETLHRWRADKALEEEGSGETRYRILTRAVLRQIAEMLPENPEQLKRVHGIGKRTVQRYGDEILAIIAAYRAKQGSAEDPPRR